MNGKMPTSVLVREVMKRGVITVTPDTTIKEVVDILTSADIGSVVVISKGRIVGVLTEGDIIKDVLGKSKDYHKTRVKEVMKHPVRTVLPETDIEKAAEIMRDLTIEMLPVVSKGKLVGLLTERDMIQIEPALIDLMQSKAAAAGVPITEKRLVISGECEECGTYSETLRNVEGRFLCEDCRAAGP